MVDSLYQYRQGGVSDQPDGTWVDGAWDQPNGAWVHAHQNYHLTGPQASVPFLARRNGCFTPVVKQLK